MQSRERLLRAAAAQASDRVGFTIPWELLIPVLVELLEACFLNDRARFVDVAKSPTAWDMLRLERSAIRSLRGSGERFSGGGALTEARARRVAANALVAAMLDTAMQASDEDLLAACVE